jgi:hypothetical protein
VPERQVHEWCLRILSVGHGCLRRHVLPARFVRLEWRLLSDRTRGMWRYVLCVRPYVLEWRLLCSRTGRVRWNLLFVRLHVLWWHLLRGRLLRRWGLCPAPTARDVLYEQVVPVALDRVLRDEPHGAWIFLGQRVLEPGGVVRTWRRFSKNRKRRLHRIRHQVLHSDRANVGAIPSGVAWRVPGNGFQLLSGLKTRPALSFMSAIPTVRHDDPLKGEGG